MPKQFWLADIWGQYDFVSFATLVNLLQALQSLLFDGFRAVAVRALRRGERLFPAHSRTFPVVSASESS